MNKSQLFKKIIIEAVKEAIRDELRDELRDIIREELKGVKPLVEKVAPKKKVNFADFLPGRKNMVSKSPNTLLEENLKGNPLASLIQDTARNLTADEMNRISSGGGGAVEAPVM